jgi:hypothetical protein
MINNYIHYIITSDGWLYCDYFKGKKIDSFKCNIKSGTVKHSLISPLTEKGANEIRLIKSDMNSKRI